MCSIVKRHLQRSQTQIYTTSTNIKTGRHVLVQSQIQYYRPQLQPGCGYHFLFASHVGLSICRTVHGSVVLFCLSPKWSDLLQIEIKMFLNGPSITPLHDMLKVETATVLVRENAKNSKIELTLVHCGTGNRENKKIWSADLLQVQTTVFQFWGGYARCALHSRFSCFLCFLGRQFHNAPASVPSSRLSACDCLRHFSHHPQQFQTSL